MLYKVTDDTLISSQSSLTNTTSRAPSIAGKKFENDDSRQFGVHRKCKNDAKRNANKTKVESVQLG